MLNTHQIEKDRIMQSKRCTKCSKVKPLSQFSKQRSGAMGCMSYCKLCQVAANKERRHVVKHLADTMLTQCWKCNKPLLPARAKQERKRMLAEEKKFGCGAGLPVCKDCQIGL